MGTVELTKTDDISREVLRDAATRSPWSIAGPERATSCPIANGTIRAMDLRQIKTGPDDFGLMSYDPAFLNTASCTSRITFIDGDKGILRYRGYPIEVLAEKCTYLEVAYLLLYGELPDRKQYEQWVHDITYHTMIHESLKKLMDAFNYDAHPMGMLIATVAAMSTFYPEAPRHPRRRGAHQADPPPDRQDADDRGLRLQAQHGDAVRLSRQRPRLQRELPDHALQDAGRGLQAQPDPRRARSTCSSSSTPTTSRTAAPTRCAAIGSAHTDPYSAVAGAAAALYGPLHGGANEEVLRMLAGDRLDRARAGVHQGGQGGQGREAADGLRPPRLQELRPARQDHQADGRRGLRRHGPQPAARHRARARAHRAAGRLLRQAQALPQRRLLFGPHLPGASAFPTAAFTVLFAIPRTSGWLAQWEELLEDPEQKIARPRQVYLGAGERPFVPMEKR